MQVRIFSPLYATDYMTLAESLFDALVQSLETNSFILKAAAITFPDVSVVVLLSCKTIALQCVERSLSPKVKGYDVHMVNNNNIEFPFLSESRIQIFPFGSDRYWFILLEFRFLHQLNCVKLK